MAASTSTATAMPEDRWDTFSLDKISLLIRLRELLQNMKKSWYQANINQISKIVTGLGFGPVVIITLWNKASYRDHVLSEVEATLDRLEQAYQSKYGIYPSDVDFSAIQSELLSGVPSLQTQISLGNPFVVAQVEEHFELQVTGSYTLLIENWNKQYYTPQSCEAYNKPYTCMLRSIVYGDLETFKRLYPNNKAMTYSCVEKAVINGRLEILHYIMEQNPDEPDIVSKHPNILFSAISPRHDNSQMIEHLLSMPGMNESYNSGSLKLKAIANKAIDVNLNTFVSLAELTRDDVEMAISTIVLNGQTSAFKIIEGRYPEFFDQDIWDRSFYVAAMTANDEFVRYVRPHMANTNLNYARILNGVLNDNVGNGRFKYVLDLPEIGKDEIVDFLHEESAYRRLRKGDYIYKFILQSGKISQEELDKLH